jgi:hypothetical protein
MPPATLRVSRKCIRSLGSNRSWAAARVAPSRTTKRIAVLPFHDCSRLAPSPKIYATTRTGNRCGEGRFRALDHRQFESQLAEHSSDVFGIRVLGAKRDQRCAGGSTRGGMGRVSPIDENGTTPFATNGRWLVICQESRTPVGVRRLPGITSPTGTLRRRASATNCVRLVPFAAHVTSRGAFRSSISNFRGWSGFG